MSTGGDDEGEEEKKDAHRPIPNLPNMHTYEPIVRRARDCKRVPLSLAHARNVEEEPLAGFVAERRLEEAQFHGAGGVHEDGDEAG